MPARSPTPDPRASMFLYAGEPTPISNLAPATRRASTIHSLLLTPRRSAATEHSLPRTR